MDEISEYLYQTLAALLLCTAIVIALFQGAEMDQVRECTRYSSETVSFNETGFGMTDDGKIVSGKMLIAYILSAEDTDIYVDGKFIPVINSDIIPILADVKEKVFTLEYSAGNDESKRKLLFYEVN